MSFGYATGEFEVTEDRLGVYRPEEHIGKYLHSFILYLPWQWIWAEKLIPLTFDR
jgi:hypothetical protein